MEPKPGNQTSEYRLAWLANIISIVVVILPAILEMLDKGSLAYVILSCVLAVAVQLGSLGYSKSRAIVKASAATAGGGVPAANPQG